MPRSVLLGRVVPEGERTWLEEDAEAVFAYIREQALLCPGCGLPRDETMAREAEGRFRTRALVCHACAVRARHERSFGPHPSGGLYFMLERL